MLDSLDCLCGLDGLSSRFTGRGARSQRLSWNRAWGRGSPGARGEGGQRTGSAPGAGRSRAARGGGRPQLASGVPPGGGRGPGGGEGGGRGGAGVGSWRGWGRASPWSSRGSPWRLGTPTSCAPGSPRIGIQWARRRGADHRSGNWDCVEQGTTRSEEHTSELQSPKELVCRLLLEKKKKQKNTRTKRRKSTEEGKTALSSPAS